jgi:hypothetical protein
MRGRNFDDILSEKAGAIPSRIASYSETQFPKGHFAGNHLHSPPGRNAPCIVSIDHLEAESVPH